MQFGTPVLSLSFTEVSNLWSRVMNLPSIIGTANQPKTSVNEDTLKLLDSYKLKPHGKLYPISKLPNALAFRITALSKHHPILEKYGIKVRQFKPLDEGEYYTNKPMNRNNWYQFSRLNENRHNPHKF